jgi:regulatory protein
LAGKMVKVVQMGMITTLKMDGKGKRVSVFVDGSFSFSIDREVVAGANLEVGKHLSADQIEGLIGADLSHRCFGAALYYLSYRPRSEAEVRQRLRRRGFGDDVVDKVIVELKERELIDDVAFAQYWKDNRQSFRPRSRQLLKLELRQKGIAAEMADKVVGDLSDEISAYEAGLKKARALAALDYGEFSRRLSSYLRRRGFGYGVTSSAVARLWQEQKTTSI